MLTWILILLVTCGGYAAFDDDGQGVPPPPR